jgi:hypothetical protein
MSRVEAEDPTNRTIVLSEIPPGHTSKREIEDGLRSVLVGVRGEWRIAVICSRTGVWWVLRVEGPGFEWMTVLVGPTEQNATEMTRRLLRALHDSKVLS